MSDIELYKKMVNLPQINYLRRNPKFEISYQPSNLIDFTRVNPKYDAKQVPRNQQIQPYDSSDSFNNKMFVNLMKTQNEIKQPFPTTDIQREYIPSLIVRNDMYLLKRFSLEDQFPGRYSPESDIQAKNEAMLYLNKQYN